MSDDPYRPREHDDLVEPLFAGLRPPADEGPERSPRRLGTACVLLLVIAAGALLAWWL